jgi:hypothetical protein
LSTKAKGVFLCFLDEKQAKSGKISVKQAPERSIGLSGAFFFVLKARKRPKASVYFLRFFPLQRTKKSVRTVGLEPAKAI